jgi:hypothetical protein
MTDQSLTCLLCNQPLDISKARTDGQGRSVHSHCYAKALVNSNPDESGDARMPPAQRTPPRVREEL